MLNSTFPQGEREQLAPEYSGLEPALSAGLSGNEPVLGGELREWPSIVAHLLADQHQAQRNGEWERVRVIRRLRARVWREADEESWHRAQHGNIMTDGVHLSRWRASESEDKLGRYERPVYDKIKDETALTAMELELAEARAALEQARTYGRKDLVREHETAIALIETYVERWR